MQLLCIALAGHWEVVQLLLAARAKKEALLINGFTALHLAADVGRSEVVDVLIKAAVQRVFHRRFPPHRRFPGAVSQSLQNPPKPAAFLFRVAAQ